MLILASTSDKLRLLTASAGSIDVHASWLDNVAGAVQPGRTNTPTITGATTTDIVGSPASGVFRNIKTVHVHNRGTTNNTVAVLHTDGATSVELHRATLAPKDTLQYIDEVGFRHVTTSGDDGASRVLLSKIIPSATPEIIFGPEFMLNPNFDIFELEYRFSHQNSIDELTALRFSLDNGATYPSNVGVYHHTGYALSSGGAPGWNVFSCTSVATFAIIANGIGPGFAALGTCKIWQGAPVISGVAQAQAVRIQAEGIAWTQSTSPPPYQTNFRINAGLYGAPGTATHMKVFNASGGNFSANYGYFKLYGLR